MLDVAAELNYVANPIARGMKKQKTQTVSVIVADLSCIFFHPLLKGIQDVLVKHGYALSIYDTDYCSERELLCLRAQQKGIADGIIMASVAECHKDYFGEDSVQGGNDLIPIVSVEANLNKYGIDSVVVDNHKGAMTAVNHLIELGCKKILHIYGPLSVRQSEQRRQGYCTALLCAGIPCDKRLMIGGDFSARSGYNAVNQALMENVFFDGIFAANDQMAVGAIHALRDARINVPEQVKIVGFDDMFISSVSSPALTTIHVPKYEMGMKAAEMLLERIEKSKKVVSVSNLDLELMVRASTIPPCDNGVQYKMITRREG